MLWQLESSQVPFHQKFAPQTPNIESCIKNLEFELEDEVFHPNSTFVRMDSGAILVHTDGACIRNGREDAVGGIGVWFGPGHRLNVSATPSYPKVTNNVMELLAIKRALEIANENNEKLIKIALKNMQFEK